MTKARAVIDTNVLVRAMIRRSSTSGLVLHRLRAGDFTLVYSNALLAELAAVLGRERIRVKYGVDPHDVRELVRLLIARGDLVEPARRIRVCRDPKDDMVLEAAVAGNADVVVSEDSDLQVLSPFEGMLVARSVEFLQFLARSTA